jgi:hypothetical protein
MYAGVTPAGSPERREEDDRMQRIRRSWDLVKSSWAVLRADKELLLYPVTSGIVTSIAMVVLFGVWLGSGGLARLDDESFGIVDLILAFILYFVVSTVVVFFNSALIAAANIRLEGGDPTLSDGFRIAFSHIGPILGWAAIAATVGLLLQALRERGGAAGAIVSLIGTLAWSVITFLVVPILVVEGVGPVEAIKRSASLLRTTWGEQIVGNFSIGLVVFLAFLAAAVVGGLAVFLLFSVAVVLGVLGAAFLVGGLIILGLIGAALSGIFNVALYRYAVGKDSSRFFPSETLEGAFRQR